MAVAARARRLGYWRGPGLAVWEREGRFQAEALHHVLACLEDYPDQRVVVYEWLCGDAVVRFRPLFEFAGLRWDGAIERFIYEHSQAGDRSEQWGTARNSRSMIGVWRADVTVDETQALKAGFLSLPLPWYQEPSAW
jgi:hypothetical protein